MAANDANKKDDNRSDSVSSGLGLKDTYIKYKKYIAAGVMAVLLAVVIFSSSAASKDADKTQDGRISKNEENGNNTEEFEINEDPQISELVVSYYDYYADGDVDSIEKIAYPITEAEKDYIKMFSRYLEQYEDIQCYTKKGMKDGEYIVFVSHKMKFKDIDSAAPGLACFYVRKDKNKTAYIDNAYSQFNQSKKENETDEKINALLTESGKNEVIAGVQKDIQKEYDSVLEEDQALNKMVTGTIRDLVTSFESQTSTDDAQTDKKEDLRRTAYAKTSVNLRKKRSTDSDVVKTLKAGSKVTIYGVSRNGWFKVKSGNDTGFVKKEYIVSDPSKAEGADKKTSSGSSVKTRTAYAKTKVNLRKKRSTNSDILTALEAGTKVTVYGRKQNGWYRVKAGSASGYVRSDYLVSDKSKAEQQPVQQAASAARYYVEGDQITLSDSVNVRQSMSENAGLIGLAYKGDVVTVIMSYAEGWTRVSWNGQTGYIKTEVLK